jgi:hypothetical protein
VGNFYFLDFFLILSFVTLYGTWGDLGSAPEVLMHHIKKLRGTYF